MRVRPSSRTCGVVFVSPTLKLSSVMSSAGVVHTQMPKAFWNGCFVKYVKPTSRWAKPKEQWVAVQALGDRCKADAAPPRLLTKLAEFGRARHREQAGGQTRRSLSEARGEILQRAGRPS